MAWTTFSIFGLLFLTGSINAAKFPNIVGGSDASIKNFPYLVSIRDNDGDHFCTGSIISERHILTAAHCVWDEDKDGFTVHSGASRSDETGHIHRVESMHIHSKYTSDELGWYDIAVLTLKDPIVFNKVQQKINLPSHDIDKYQTAYVLGWGRMSLRWEWNSGRGRQLQKLVVALLPSDKCKPFIETKIDEKQVCAFRSLTKGSCAGDSGGPLVSHGEIVGLVSRGDISNCVDGHPDINTNVFAYKDFIESVMKE